MCKRYSILPSQALKLGNSIDIRCAITAIEYENYLHKKANADGKVVDEPSEQQMLDMMQRVRGQKDG